MSGRWHVALGYALTGVELGLDAGSRSGRPFVTRSLVPRERSSGTVFEGSGSGERSSGTVGGGSGSGERSSGTVGEESGAGEGGREPDPARLVVQLADAGWPRERILEHALARAAAGQPWPHQVPADLREGCGAAQFHAALGATRAVLGLIALESRAPSGRTQLNPDEERLLREVPPHHGV